MALRREEIELVSRRANPLLIATVGEVDAGKSSFLGMLHSLLLRGHGLAQYTFAGSLTLLGWEALAVALRFHRGQAIDQSPTPSDPTYYSLLHWALRRADGQLRDILFPDASGEVFTQWAANEADSNAANVRWIHRYADAFLFFIDCEALVKRRGGASTSLIDLASRLVTNLNGRPVLVAWSKADLLEQIRPGVKQNLEEQLAQLFGEVPHFAISKELEAQPDPQQLANLRLLDAALSAVETYRPTLPGLAVNPVRQDHFLRYRGR
ncbi:TRAFAC clade GTPase domain-containing protein [Hymenobacter terrigena]